MKNALKKYWPELWYALCLTVLLIVVPFITGCAVNADTSVPSSLMGKWEGETKDYRGPEWAPQGYGYWKAGYVRGKQDCINEQKEGR